MAVQIPIISEFDGTGVKKAVAEFKQLETTGQKAQYALKKAAVPATAALAGLGAVLVSATKGAMEDAAAQDALANQLKRTTGATDSQIAATEDWISAQGKALGVADDQLRPALSKLATASGDISRAQKLAATAMDISSATGKNYEAVVTALTKAELGQYTGLKKLGIATGDQTQALIDMSEWTKKVGKAQLDLDAALQSGDKKEIAKATEKLREAQEKLNQVTVSGADYVNDLNKAFGGAATEAANTAEGSFKRLTLSLSETKESIGAALLPVVQAVLPYLQSFGLWAQEHPTAFLTIAGAIAGVATAIIAVNAAMALNPFTAIAAGVALLVVGLVAAYEKFKWFQDGVNAVIDGIVGVFEGWANAWIMTLNAIIRAWNLVPGHDDVGTIGHVNFGGGGGSRGGGRLAVPAMAEGGIVTGPTLALIGEAGPEAVVPLNKMGGMGGNVTINVNGGDPQAVVDTITRWYRQNGATVAWMR